MLAQTTPEETDPEQDKIVEWCVCVMRALSSDQASRAYQSETVEVVPQMMVGVLKRYVPLISSTEHYNGVRWDIVNQSIATLWNLSVNKQFAAYFAKPQLGLASIIRDVNNTTANEFVAGFKRQMQNSGHDLDVMSYETKREKVEAIVWHLDANKTGFMEPNGTAARTSSIVPCTS